MFGSVIDKVQSLFSRSFLLGAYFPVLIFAAMNAIIALLGLPEEIVSLAMIKKSWPTDATVQAALTAWIFISIGVVAYILSSLNELLRRILEGRYLLGLVEYVSCGQRRQTYQQSPRAVEPATADFDAAPTRRADRNEKAGDGRCPGQPADSELPPGTMVPSRPPRPRLTPPPACWQATSNFRIRWTRPSPRLRPL